MVDASFLFGLLQTDGSQDEQEFTSTIGEHDNIDAAASYTDGQFALIAEYSTAQELSDVGIYLRGLKSVQSVELHTYLTRPGKKIELKKLHLRVLACLDEDARMSIIEIVKKTGLSARRVRRALNEMIESRAVFFRARLELGAESDIPFLIWASYDESKIDPDGITNWLWDDYPLPLWEIYISAMEPVFIALFATDHLTELDSVIRSVRQKEFVKNAKVMVSTHHQYFTGPTRLKLREMIENLDST